MPPLDQSIPDALPNGTRLDSFEIEGVLGQGGFGITYAARDVQTRRRYALKEFFPRGHVERDSDLIVTPLSSGNQDTLVPALNGFIDEARILETLSHPSVVRAERDFEANGTAYLAMEFVTGEPLSSMIDREGAPLDPAQLEAIARNLLHALDYLHNADIVHRDIKPENIIVRDNGIPVLIDFGTASNLRALSRERSSAFASPGYTALEQYMADGSQGPMTDIYGLCASLYFAVRGAAPPDALKRLDAETYSPLAPLAGSARERAFLSAIDQGLSLDAEDRLEGSAALTKHMAAAAPLRPAKSLKRAEAKQTSVPAAQVQPRIKNLRLALGATTLCGAGVLYLITTYLL